MEPNQLPNQPRNRSSQLFLSIAFLSIALLLVYFRQSIFDHFMLWSYQPSAAISQLANKTTMTDEGRFYFYVSHPQIDDRAAFNKDCNNKASEQSIVLGCYAGERIYVFDVTDTRLTGIREVTAAHEMLHAAYQRLTDSERAHVDDLINQQLKSITDMHIQKLIDVYAKTEPGEKLNELHSIFGTELATLNPELEQYYKQYFSDRAALVALEQNYQSVFDELEAKQTALVSELTVLAGTISTEEASYTADAAQLNGDITTFNARAESGQMTSSEFASQRAVLAARQATLKAEFERITADIATYNEKRQELETINLQASNLNHSIDSTLSPVPSF